MILKLSKLDNKRQDSIINSALKEFAKNGFYDASTNKIAKEAGISKGLLFHYINNKSDLFLYLWEYSSRIIIEDILGSVNMNEKDILERYRQIALIKMELLNKYPHILDFIMIAISTESEEIKGAIGRNFKGSRENYFQKLFEDIDTSQFKDGIDAAKVKNLIIWALNGYSDVFIEKIKNLKINDLNYDEILEEFDSYLEVLRKCFYKEIGQ